MNISLEQKKLALQTMSKKIDLRTAKTTAEYKKYLKNNKQTNCIYCDKELFVREFKHWIILENRFPYDKIAETSHMLATKRHLSSESELNKEELSELLEIKKDKLDFYDIILQSTPSACSRPDHFHLHIMRYHRIAETPNNNSKQKIKPLSFFQKLKSTLNLLD